MNAGVKRESSAKKKRKKTEKLQEKGEDDLDVPIPDAIKEYEEKQKDDYVGTVVSDLMQKPDFLALLEVRRETDRGTSILFSTSYSLFLFSLSLFSLLLF